MDILKLRSLLHLRRHWYDDKYKQIKRFKHCSIKKKKKKHTYDRQNILQLSALIISRESNRTTWILFKVPFPSFDIKWHIWKSLGKWMIGIETKSNMTAENYEISIKIRDSGSRVDSFVENNYVRRYDRRFIFQLIIP